MMDNDDETMMTTTTMDHNNDGHKYSHQHRCQKPSFIVNFDVDITTTTGM